MLFFVERTGIAHKLNVEQPGKTTKVAIKRKGENENSEVRARLKNCAMKAHRDWKGCRGKIAKILLLRKILHIHSNRSFGRFSLLVYSVLRDPV